MSGLPACGCVLGFGSLPDKFYQSSYIGGNCYRWGLHDVIPRIILSGIAEITEDYRGISTGAFQDVVRRQGGCYE